MDGHSKEEKEKLINADQSGSYGGLAGSIQDKSPIGETAQDYKARWKSIRVLYMTMFFSSAQFAIVMSSLWPYLQKLDSTVNTTFLGWTNSGFSLCQMIGSIVFGIWCHHRPAKEPLLFSILLVSAGSLLYGYGEAFRSDGINTILSARLLLGLSAGNAAVCRAVVSQSTTLSERTRAFANLAIWQGIGFAFGPAMQVAVIPIGDKGIYFDSLKLSLDIYTAPGFLGFLMAVVNFISILRWFAEFEIDIYEGQKKVKVDRTHTPKPDLTAIAVSTLLFFVLMSVFALNETIITPLLMDEFAWTDTQTVLYGGIILSVAGIIAIFCFEFVKYLSRRYSDRAVIAGGLVIILVGFMTYMPWGNAYPKVKTSEIISGGNMTRMTTGCPQKYAWCKTTPKLYLPQFLTAATLVGIGYPIAFLAVNTIYSKILGPRQQGAYMAWISSVGSLARVVGPLLVTHAYVSIGPRWTFFCVNVIVTMAILVFACYYHRVVPFHDFVQWKYWEVVA